MAKLKYANTEINFTVERLVELAQMGIDGLRCYGEDTAQEYFRETMELTDYEREFFGVPADEENEEEDSEPWFADYDMEEPWDYEERNYQRLHHDEGYDDDSDRGCKDCPPDECTGHCMSCWYRPV